MKKIAFILFIGIFLIVPGLSGATSVVYDNTGESYNFYATEHFGDEITLAGTDRFVTEFIFSYEIDLKTGQTATPQTGTIRFYENDGTDGAPSTLLWESESFSLGIGDYYVTLTVPFIEVPDTFIWTFQFNEYDTDTYYYFSEYRRPVNVGSSADYLWFMTSSGWQQGVISDGMIGDFLYAKVTAESSTRVPEPSVGLLMCIGLAAIVRFRMLFMRQ